jgi:hypothetical protein
VGLGAHADDDHERPGEPPRQAVYGVQRVEDVRYPRLVEDRQTISLNLSAGEAVLSAAPRRSLV